MNNSYHNEFVTCKRKVQSDYNCSVVTNREKCVFLFFRIPSISSINRILRNSGMLVPESAELPSKSNSSNHQPHFQSHQLEAKQFSTNGKKRLNFEAGTVLLLMKFDKIYFLCFFILVDA